MSDQIVIVIIGQVGMLAYLIVDSYLRRKALEQQARLQRHSSEKAQLDRNAIQSVLVKNTKITEDIHAQAQQVAQAVHETQHRTSRVFDALLQQRAPGFKSEGYSIEPSQEVGGDKSAQVGSDEPPGVGEDPRNPWKQRPQL